MKLSPKLPQNWHKLIFYTFRVNAYARTSQFELVLRYPKQQETKLELYNTLWQKQHKSQQENMVYGATSNNSIGRCNSSIPFVRQLYSVQYVNHQMKI